MLTGSEDTDGSPPKLAVGAQIRVKRKQARLTLKQLAGAVGISASALSQIETDKAQPSLVTLYAIVTRLGVSLDEIFPPVAAEPPGDSGLVDPDGAVEFLPAASQKVLELKSGELWRRLNGRSIRNLDFLAITYPPGGAQKHAHMTGKVAVWHSGRELNYVLSGRIIVEVNDAQYDLGPGDSLAFDSRLPHLISNPGHFAAETICLFVGSDGPDLSG